MKYVVNSWKEGRRFNLFLGTISDKTARYVRRTKEYAVFIPFEYVYFEYFKTEEEESDQPMVGKIVKDTDFSRTVVKDHIFDTFQEALPAFFKRFGGAGKFFDKLFK